MLRFRESQSAPSSRGGSLIQRNVKRHEAAHIQSTTLSRWRVVARGSVRAALLLRPCPTPRTRHLARLLFRFQSVGVCDYVFVCESSRLNVRQEPSPFLTASYRCVVFVFGVVRFLTISARIA